MFCFYFLYSGRLEAVRNLSIQYLREVNGYNLSWVAPPTMNVSFIMENTSYCVHVHSSRSHTSQCNRKKTHYVLSQLDSSTKYEVNITAVNAGGRGITSSIALPG